MIIDFIKYALYYVKDEICKLLLDKRADVDAMEPRLGEVHYFDGRDIFVQVIHFTESNHMVSY